MNYILDAMSVGLKQCTTTRVTRRYNNAIPSPNPNACMLMFIVSSCIFNLAVLGFYVYVPI